MTDGARYKRKQTLLLLNFEDTGLDGLMVATRRISTEGLLGFIEMMDEAERLQGASESFRPEDLGVVRKLFTEFAGVLAEWNLDDDDDQPVPATAAGLLSQDPEFVMQIISAWITAMSSAPPPLNGGSSSGANSPEAALAAASRSLGPQS